jgi:hypothetical protein
MSSLCIHETLTQMLCTYKLLAFSSLSICVYSITGRQANVIMKGMAD